MKKTSEKIVDTALRLFNTEGLSQVTLRTIAKEMKISQGNLNYHFKKREDIIETLYYRLVKDMDAGMAGIDSSQVGLSQTFAMSAAFMKSAFRYRFFFLDFSQIIREHDAIKIHYKGLLNIRKSQMIGLFEAMVGAELMREEQLPNEFSNLYKRIQIFGDFWIASAEIEKEKLEESMLNEYLEMIRQALYPYLTTKGVKEYAMYTDGI